MQVCLISGCALALLHCTSKLNLSAAAWPHHAYKNNIPWKQRAYYERGELEPHTFLVFSPWLINDSRKTSKHSTNLSPSVITFVWSLQKYFTFLLTFYSFFLFLFVLLFSFCFFSLFSFLSSLSFFPIQRQVETETQTDTETDRNRNTLIPVLKKTHSFAIRNTQIQKKNRQTDKNRKKGK